MSENPAGAKALLGALMGIVVIALLMTYVLRRPCERILVPCCLGLKWRSWSAIGHSPIAELCRQVQGVIPWSVNLNCMADDAGALYLSCSRCEGKYWSGRAMAIPTPEFASPAKYPVRLSRLQDAEILTLLGWLEVKTGFGRRAASRSLVVFCRSQSLKRG